MRRTSEATAVSTTSDPKDANEVDASVTVESKSVTSKPRNDVPAGAWVALMPRG